MKKYLCILSAVLIVVTMFSACSSQSNKPLKPSESQSQTASDMPTVQKTANLEKGYSIDELQEAVITAMRKKDPNSIEKYVLSKSNSAIKYAYQKFDSDTSALVDLEVDNLNNIFDKCSQDNINFGDSAKYNAEELVLLSKATDEVAEELNYIYQDVKKCLNGINCEYKITDFALFEIVAEDEEYSKSINTLLVNTDNGWFVFGFDA